jgi:excisionase family DNA binding protein
VNRATRQFIEQRLLTTQEASALSGIPAVTLQKRVARGQLDAVVKGRTYLFDRTDIEALSRHRASNRPPAV